MVRTIPERFITRYTAVDRELADRQWAEWRATRRHLLQIGAFAGAGLALRVRCGADGTAVVAAARAG